MQLAARYAAAERLLPARVKELVLRGRVVPGWHGDILHYSVRTENGFESFAVDCVTGTRTAAPPPRRPAVAVHELLSPDASRVAFVRDFDLWVREVGSGGETRLTADGTADRPYATSPDFAAPAHLLGHFGLEPPPLAVWSPDSTRLLTHRLDQSAVTRLPLVESTPPDGGRPRLEAMHYALPGDERVTTMQLLVLDVQDGARVTADREFLAPYLSPLLLNQAWWDHDGATVRYLDFGRRAERVELCAVDAVSGRTCTVLSESAATQVQLGPFPLSGRHNVRVLRSGEVLWWSERTGWGHLYLYAPDGACRPLTGGDWLVRDLVAVDEERRLVWFTGAGREPGLDPYARQVYEVPLDGGEVRRVTDDDLDHDVTASPDQRFAVDVASSPSRPAVSTLRTVGSRTEIELETADAAALFAAGWVEPERFEVLAADGVTPLWGLLYPPHGLDPQGRYPVLDDIYPGPQVTAAPPRFPGSGGRTTSVHAASMAALGFAVVVVDARGTPSRSKAFQDATRESRDVLLDDHVAAVRQLAETRPWLDLDRVGIYGSSGGGQQSTRALLLHPDFYKVGVSSCGDHDDALYQAAWAERFFDGDLAAASNSGLASRLEGKLLLIHGDEDHNVGLHQTLRLVDALMVADRDADLLVVPGSDHAMLTHQHHWIRRRWDYFVRHLMGAEPPDHRLAPVPIDLEELFG